MTLLLLVRRRRLLIAWFGSVGVSAAAVLACENTNGLSNDDNGTQTKRDSGKGSSSGTSGQSGSSGTAGDPDGGETPSGPLCDPSQPFALPELVTDFDGSASTKGAVMTSDGLEVFYLRKASPWELRHGRRETRDKPWEIVTDGLLPSADSALSIAAGGLKLYFWKLESSGTMSNPKMYVATRTARVQNFGMPVFLSTPKGRPMFVSSDDAAGYWSDITQADSGTINETIVRSSLSANGALTFTAVPNIHTDGALDSKPVLNEAETVVYFSSNRPGGSGDSGDIFSARRPNKTGSFGAATHEAELSSANLDSVTWVSPDDCEVLMDRASHVYLARRPK